MIGIQAMTVTVVEMTNNKMSHTDNIIFEASNIGQEIELMLIEKGGEFQLHVVKSDGLSMDGKEFVNNVIVMNLEISDIVRLIDAVYPYLKKEGLEV